MSMHDDIFDSVGVPTLMEHFGTAGVIDVFDASGSNLIFSAEGILGPIEGIDEIDPHGIATKKLTRRIDIKVDEAELVGLRGDYTKAKIVVDNEVGWMIEQVRSLTPTMQRLELIRKVPTAKRRSGYTLEDR